ncbi:hypothetical protein Ocin01_07611 [Orchesella cincta]|uniref:Uncharacterized protein n=1 Tax=Orchesella cincta TaxID=48709 RepID=A0A1D2N1A4_ORCCI|nr:hypothetical protein Ocin01_07611 [Orchesella cincta]
MAEKARRLAFNPCAVNFSKMSLAKQLWNLVKKDKAMNMELESAKANLITSQLIWQKSAIDVANIQFAIIIEDIQMEYRLRQVGNQQLTDESSEDGELVSPTKPISHYKTMVDTDKWTNFRSRLNQANAKFNQVKLTWLSAKEEVTIWMTMKEIITKVQRWKESEAIANYWASKYDDFLEEWENIKLELEKCIQYCANLAAISEEKPDTELSD